MHVGTCANTPTYVRARMYVHIHDPVHMYRARKMHMCDLHIYAYLPTNISVCIHSVSSELGIIHRSPALIQCFTDHT